MPLEEMGTNVKKSAIIYWFEPNTIKDGRTIQIHETQFRHY